MATTLAGEVIRRADGQPIANAPVRLIALAANIGSLAGASTFDRSSWGWTRQLTGFGGTRWECWERFLKDTVPGLRWEQFCDPSLLVNPALQNDHLFRPEQTYCIPAPLNEPLAYVDTWSDDHGVYQFALGDAPVVVAISASAPGVYGSTALLVNDASVATVSLSPVAPPTVLGASARPTATMAATIASGSVRSTRPDYVALPATARRVVDQALFMLGDDAATFDAMLPQHQRMCYGSLFMRNPADLHYKDICCADLVSISLAAAGLDIAWSAYNGNTRMADYYHPHNGDGKLIEVFNTADYLPGDVFVFGNGNRESRALHVALYVGPFAGTDRSGHPYLVAKNCEAVEASIDVMRAQREQGTAVRGIPLASCLNGEYGTFSWVRRVRLRQLAQAFGQ